jgi:uncharacterized protein YdcH (DUF465 family)
LQAASAEPLYFETVIMNVDIQRDKKQIKLLELSIQHGEEKKVDYDLIDYAVGTYIDVVKTQLLTLAEYAAGTNESVAEVRKRIECAEVICEFLDYLKLPEQYHVARDLQVYSLFQEMMQPLKALTGDEKQQLKRITFNNVLLHAVPDQRKFIRDIKGLIKNNAHAAYFGDQEKLNERIHQKFDGEIIRGKADLDRFAQANVQLAEEMQVSMQQALYRARNRQLKERPAENMAKIKSLLNDVDPRLFGKMEPGEKQELQQGLQEVSEMMERFAEALTGKPMGQKSVVPAGPVAQPHVLRAASADPKKPYVVCASAGTPILRYFVSMRFQAIALGEHITEPATCKAYFVNDNGEAISNIRLFTLEAGQTRTENFAMLPACQTQSSCRLIIQDADGADDEALQVIPFELRISAGFRK